MEEAEYAAAFAARAATTLAYEQSQAEEELEAVQAAYDEQARGAAEANVSLTHQAEEAAAYAQEMTDIGNLEEARKASAFARSAAHEAALAARALQEAVVSSPRGHAALAFERGEQQILAASPRGQQLTELAYEQEAEDEAGLEAV